jgi:CheY-like chemotaxis protein
VLIVDDDLMLRELVRNFIEDSGLTVQFKEASHTKMALDIIESDGHNLSLIICDYDMPGENGLRVIEYWQKYFNNIPFILFSSISEQAKLEYKKKYGEVHSRLHFVNKDEGVDGFQYSLLELWRHGFSPMPLKYFRVGKRLNSDFYIRVNHTNILKVFNSGEIIEKERIDAYREKGLKNFYINHKDYSLNKCLHFHFPLFSSDSGVLGASEALKEFELSFREILETQVVQVDSLENNFNQLSIDLSTLEKNKTYKFLSQMDFSKNNYVINHSFLIVLLSNLILKEMGLLNHHVRQSVLQSVILHDLIFDDDEAWKRDLYNSLLEEEERVSVSRSESKLKEKVESMNLDHDSLTIFNALKRGLFEDHYHVPGNHKVAHVVVSVHKLTNELYSNEFSRPAGDDLLESFFKVDREILKAAKNLLYC